MSLKNFLHFFISLVLFWMLVFFVERSANILYFFTKIPNKSASGILELFIHSLRLDLSISSYLIAIPLLSALLLSLCNKISWLPKFLKFYQPAFLIFLLLVGWINMNLYREWGVKVNYKAIMIFFQFPYEVTISGFTIALLIPTLIYILLAFLFLILNKFLISNINFENHNTDFIRKSSIGIFFIAANVLCIRGGWQLSPINISMAQFSNIPIHNHLSTNTVWQLVDNTIFELKPTKSQYRYFTNDQMDSILAKQIHIDSSLNIIKPDIKSPNVVLIILESYTADLIESLGGEKGVATNFESLINQGLLFKNIYASGERTDKGIIAILSSFPSQAIRSIIKEEHKQIKLPSISQQFKKNNYTTSFYYGGESEFFGLKSYLLSHSFDKIIDKDNFDSKDFNSKWGAHDGVVLKRHIADMNKSKGPFFSTILTLSNHEPFEIPIPAKYKGNNLSNKFRNTAYYTDASLGEYFKEAKNQDWYSNTLFILVADHGHRLPKDAYEIWDSRRYRIPLIFYGDVLKDDFKGLKIDTYGSQTDIAKTLYNQLKFNHEEFIWSKDLLRKDGSDGYGFFDWDNGFGMASKNFTLSYNEDAKRVILFNSKKSNVNKDDRLNFAKAYMQKIFSEYMNY